MDIQGNIEIHFHKQDIVSVSIEQNATVEHENLLNLLWFSAYAIRQIVLVGPVSEPASELIGFLHLMSGRKTIEDIVLSDNYRCSIIQNPGHPGEKGFKSEILFQPDKLENYYSKIKPYGFSLFGVGINSCAMVSVLALLRYFAENKKEDKNFLSSLAYAAEQIGLNFLIESSPPSVVQERALVKKIAEEAFNYKE